MLPTPCTSHVSFDTIYEPSEDSYLFLDTLSSPTESAFLTTRFSNKNNSTTNCPSPSPLVLEVGCGSGVVISFVAANSQLIFGRRDILPLATDVNRDACAATRETITKAIDDRQNASSSLSESTDRRGTENGTKTVSLTPVIGDLCSPLRPGSVDVLIFNPPYVPTEDLPEIAPAVSYQATSDNGSGGGGGGLSRSAKFERDSYFLSLTYAGGRDGMETTDRLLEMIPEVLHPERGVAYVLLCAQNRPEEVKARIRAWSGGWKAESVGNSGLQAGWEKLVIVRIWRG